MTGGEPPIFSIVSVVRNDLAGLQRTWASVCEQTENDLEWVVVDGASCDGTAEWLGSLSDARVKWISEADRGIYDAMNKGLALADGQVLEFLNAGDVLASPDVLGRVARDRAKRGWLWAYGMVCFVDGRGLRAGVHTGMPFRRLLLELGYRYVPHPSSFFSRDLLAALGGFDLRHPIAADQELMMRAARLTRPGLIPEVLVDFAVGGASMNQSPDAFVWQARRIRRDQGWLLAGNRVADNLATLLLAAGFRLHACLVHPRWDRAADEDCRSAGGLAPAAGAPRAG